MYSYTISRTVTDYPLKVHAFVNLHECSFIIIWLWTFVQSYIITRHRHTDKQPEDDEGRFCWVSASVHAKKKRDFIRLFVIPDMDGFLGDLFPLSEEIDPLLTLSRRADSSPFQPWIIIGCLNGNNSAKKNPFWQKNESYPSESPFPFVWNLYFAGRFYLDVPSESQLLT